MKRVVYRTLKGLKDFSVVLATIVSVFAIITIILLPMYLVMAVSLWWGVLYIPLLLVAAYYMGEYTEE